MNTIEDIKLINKRSQIKRILLAPYRKGINYLKLLDMRKEISNKLYNNSLHRVFLNNENN